MADSPTAASDDAKRDAATIQAPNLIAPVAEDAHWERYRDLDETGE